MAARPMTAITFEVRGRPVPQGSKRAFRNPHSNRIQMVESSKSLPDWRRAVADAARDAVTGTLLEGPLRVEVVFHLARPKSHFRPNGTLRPNAPAYPTTKPDLSKLIRAIEDAIKEVVWRDDAQVVSIVADKAYGDPSGCRFTVGPMPGAPRDVEAAAAATARRDDADLWAGAL